MTTARLVSPCSGPRVGENARVHKLNLDTGITDDQNARLHLPAPAKYNAGGKETADLENIITFPVVEHVDQCRKEDRSTSRMRVQKITPHHDWCANLRLMEGL